MKQITISEEKKDIRFQKAHELANQKAVSELGDCMNIAYYDGDQKLVSPTLTACSTEEKENCGADSYAKAFEADLEIDVSGRHKFYYRHVQDYETSSPSVWQGDPEGRYFAGF